MNAEKDLVIVVSTENKLVDWGEPIAFTGHMLHTQMKAGHIIRYVTEAALKASPLKPKEL